MIIAFYLGLMNFRGVANATFQYALYNEKILMINASSFNNNELVNTYISEFDKNFTIRSLSLFILEYIRIPLYLICIIFNYIDI